MNLSQQQLANKTGISRCVISDYEVGRAEPNISKLILLKKAFGFKSLDELIEEKAA